MRTASSWAPPVSKPGFLGPCDPPDAALSGRLCVTPPEGAMKDNAGVGVVTGGFDSARVKVGHDASRLVRREHSGGKTTTLLQRHALLKALSYRGRARHN